LSAVQRSEEKEKEFYAAVFDSEPAVRLALLLEAGRGAERRRADALRTARSTRST